jgi:hypothetical protein
MSKPTLLVLDEDELKAVPNPYYDHVPEIQAIVKKGRAKAVKELAYVFHTTDHTSKYASYPDAGVRAEAVRNDVFGKESKWREGDDIVALQKWYEKNIKSPSVLLLEGATLAMMKIRDYFIDIDFGHTTNTGALLHDPKKVSDTIRGLGSLVESLRKLQDEVEKDMRGGDNRRGIETDEFSE